MPALCAVFRRLLPLAVVGSAVAAIAVLRERAIARHEAELWPKVPGGPIRR